MLTKPGAHSLSLFWRLQFAGWGACAVVGLIWRSLLFWNFSHALVVTLVQESFGFALSCVLREIYRHPSFWRQELRWPVARVIGVSFLAGVLDVLIVYGVLDRYGLTVQDWSFRERLVMRITIFWLLFAGWSLLYFWIKTEFASRAHRATAEEARNAAMQAELNLLRNQLDPHFLFNTLNGLAAEIPVHPERALAMTRELADYLRYSLEHRDHTTVPLSTEVAAMAAYLRIEQARFGDQLRIDLMPGFDENRPIPAFTLQPLVENAVKHAFRTSEPPWSISVQASVTEDSLVISVRNSGALIPDSAEQRAGVGLPLLRRRLELLYPGRHHLSLIQDGAFVAAILKLEGLPCG